MSSDYRKYTVQMELAPDRFRLWKHGMDRAVCVLETYKEKRSVYFAVSNLLPSRALAEEEKEYHLILMGADNGELIHRDFGVFSVNQSGEGSFFKKFDGPVLSNYTHCLLVAVGMKGETETVLRGSTPFFTAPQKVSDAAEPAREEKPWRKFFDQNTEDGKADVFSSEIDETKAIWWRVEKNEGLPDGFASCGDLVEQYGHWLMGKTKQRWFIGVPGRFLLAEQPVVRGESFQLWQPIRGGEAFFDDLAGLSGDVAESLFGYWICEVDRETGAPRFI
ncbi:hypothetical protein ACPW7J_13585 [Ihubacter sp. rT4E-8]|uniref:hypothetical protein n=1 Tax=Ihubacter sp. rT4E-8 TaxID=3242369 RepID=UPI003CEB5555